MAKTPFCATHTWIALRVKSSCAQCAPRFFCLLLQVVTTQHNQTMKKNLLLLAAVLGLSILPSSCKKDEPAPQRFEYAIETLHGTWRITHVESKDGSMFDVTTPIAEKTIQPTYATFNADGTYSGRGYFGEGSGTYKASGKTITCYIDGTEFMKYDVLSLSGNTCELRMSKLGSDLSLRIRCKKQ